VAKSAIEKRDAPGQPRIEELSGTLAIKLKAATLLIPTPGLVDRAIRNIPPGSVKTTQQIRDELAAEFGAEGTCPLCMGIFWRVVAEAAEEERALGRQDITPWWRVTKGGKPNPKLPGGEERHRALLAAEGSIV
jgi:alkylated DNA nucleotide flippase Atl1